MHIIFDADGTLFDTEYGVSEITADLATENGASISASEVFRVFAGRGSRDKFTGIAASVGVEFSEEELKYLSAEHGARKDKLYEKNPLPLVEGIKDVLRTLTKSGHVLSVGSTNKTPRLYYGLKKTGLAHFFKDRVYGTDLVKGRRKPDPAVFQLAMNENGFSAEETIVIGDSEADAMAARNAGSFMIAYLDPRFGMGTAAEDKERSFRDVGAGAVIRSYKNLLPHIPA